MSTLREAAALALQALECFDDHPGSARAIAMKRLPMAMKFGDGTWGKLTLKDVLAGLRVALEEEETSAARYVPTSCMHVAARQGWICPCGDGVLRCTECHQAHHHLEQAAREP